MDEMTQLALEYMNINATYHVHYMTNMATP